MRAALFPTPDVKNSSRPTKYPQNDELDYTGIDFLTPVSQIPKVERQNNLGINLFGWVHGKVTSIRPSEMNHELLRMSVMLVTDNAGNQHYCFIKRISRLHASKYGHRAKMHFCEICLQGFSTERVLNEHKDYYRGVGGRAVRIEMLKKGENIIQFQNFQKQKAPYVIYADCESLIRPIDACNPDPI